MTSLTSLVRRFEDGDTRARRLIQLYRSAVAVILDHLVVSRPGARRLMRVRFDRLIAKIDRWPAGEKDICESVVTLGEILSDYRNGEEEVFAEEQQQLRKTVSSLSGLAEVLGKKHRERGQELEAVATALEDALYEPNSSAIHAVLQVQIRALKSTLVAFSESTHEAVNTIVSQTDGLLGLTSNDPTYDTGEADQSAQLEQAIREHTDHFEVFCVLAAEVSGIDEIERTWGAPARDQIFSEYRKRIERCLSDTTATAFWLGSRVILISNTAAILANRRLNKMRVLLAEPFCLASPLGDAHVRLPMRTGMIEYHGEGVADYLRRIDQSLSEHQLIAV